MKGFIIPRVLPFQVFLPWLGVFFLLLIWQGIAIAGWVNPVLFPSPLDTLQELIRLAFQPEHSLIQDLAATARRALQAFAIAAGLGVPLGVLLGSSVVLYRSVEFVVDFFRSIPASALVPLFLILFGIGDFNKVVIVAFTVFFSILFYSAYGAINVPKSRVLAAKSMGANRWEIFRDVLFWESLPQIFVGLRAGICLSLVVEIVAEMLLPAEFGLGKRIIEAQQILSVTEMYGSILLTGLLGYGLNWGCLMLEQRLIHWSGRDA